MHVPSPVDVKLRPQAKTFGCLWGLFIPMGLLFASVSFNERGPLYQSPWPLLFGGMVACTPLLLSFARRFAVARLDEDGLRLHTGKLFRWTELRGIEKVQVMKNGRKVRIDYTLGFKGGGVRVKAHEYQESDAMWRFLEHVEKHFPRAG